jgi:hypothetical protein
MRWQAVLDGRKRRRRGMQNWGETNVLVCEAKESVQIKCLEKACVVSHWQPKRGLGGDLAPLSRITTFVLAPLIIGRLSFDLFRLAAMLRSARSIRMVCVQYVVCIFRGGCRQAVRFQVPRAASNEQGYPASSFVHWFLCASKPTR